MASPPTRPSPVDPSAPLLPCSSAPCWRIGITADGLYRLSYEALAAAGVPVTNTVPSAYHLLWRGQGVALQEVGTDDGSFDPGDAFLFYGQKFHGSVQDEKYTDENVYWLAVDSSSPGARMATRSVAPAGDGTPLTWYTATVRAETNQIYMPRYTDAPETDATWFWEKLMHGQEVAFPFTLTAKSSAPYTTALTVELARRYTRDQALQFALNGAPIGAFTWTGSTRGMTVTLPFPSELLRGGKNTLTVANQNGNTYLNWLEAPYRRLPEAEDDVLRFTTHLSGATAMTLTGFTTSTVHLYDVSRPLTPTRLVDATTWLSGTAYALALTDDVSQGVAYLAVSEGAVRPITLTCYHPANELIDPSEGADEIIIAPSEFLTAIEPLADLRRSQGLRVRVVDVDDVYPLFNGGIFHPEAIRRFVAHAYQNWPEPRPAYLLLVGDGNFNFKGYSPEDYGDPLPVWIPPYLAFDDPDQGEVAVDTRYGDVDGDGWPEIYVGRVTASSVAQAEGFVDKVLAYESAPAAPWMKRALLVADDGEGFPGMLDRLKAIIPPGIEPRTVYMDDYATVEAATQALTQTWSEGAALMTYAGHAAPWQWADGLIKNVQLTQLTNTAGLPFMISLDCHDGYWMYPVKHPNHPDEDMRPFGEWVTTVLTDTGAIAAFAPSGLGYPSIEEVMARQMYRALFEDGVLRLGELTQAGREAISGSYMARTYTLLGDPAMELRMLLHPIYLPLVVRGA